MNASDNKHVVLGLIFPKYISDTFEEQNSLLEAEKAMGPDPEDQDKYRVDHMPGYRPRPAGAS